VKLEGNGDGVNAALITNAKKVMDEEMKKVKENGVGTEDIEIAKIADSLMQVVAKSSKR